MSLLPIYKKSFFASPHRPDGLGLEMHYEPGLVYSDMSIDERFEGYHHLVHGGMLFGVLDVIIWYAIFMETKKVCMTRKVEMAFFKPVKCDTVYRAKGKVLRVEGRDIWASAWIEDGDGERYCEITALFREARGLDYAEFIGNLDFTGVPPEIEAHFRSVVR